MQSKSDLLSKSYAAASNATGPNAAASAAVSNTAASAAGSIAASFTAADSNATANAAADSNATANAAIGFIAADTTAGLTPQLAASPDSRVSAVITADSSEK